MTNQPAPSDTPTPRTDHNINYGDDNSSKGSFQYVDPDFARELERELARLSAEREKERNVPLCAHHAEVWFCDRHFEPGDCWFCQKDAQIAERDRQLAEAKAKIFEWEEDYAAAVADAILLAETLGLTDAEPTTIREGITNLRIQLADSQRQKAELEAEKTFMAKNITELVDERAKLRARLAEADVSIPTAVKMQVSCFLNRDLQNDTTLGAVNELFREINSLRAKQLALESQCQRMRDALDALYNDSPEVREAVIEKYGIHHAPLDLELLNRVRDVLINILKSASPNKIENPAMYSAWRGAEELLKSLSPAP